MRIPIAHALAWPDRVASGADTLNLAEIARLDFTAPDLDNIPCLALALSAAEQGGAVPIVLNAANEVAVEAFLQKQIGFTQIPQIIEDTIDTFLAANSASAPENLAGVLNIDNDARLRAAARLSSRP